jgi:hypothetical protein
MNLLSHPDSPLIGPPVNQILASHVVSNLMRFRFAFGVARFTVGAPQSRNKVSTLFEKIVLVSCSCLALTQTKLQA